MRPGCCCFRVIRQRVRPPFPVERRPNSLVCASFNPSLQLGKERVEASGSRRPGAMDSSVGSFSPRAPETVQVERRLAWRTIACPPKDQPRSLLRLLEQGPESQSASSVCWGGVSSVMGSSDLDAHSFVPSGHKVISIKAHCLDGLDDRLCEWRARSMSSVVPYFWGTQLTIQLSEAACLSWFGAGELVVLFVVAGFADFAAREDSRC